MNILKRLFGRAPVAPPTPATPPELRIFHDDQGREYYYERGRRVYPQNDLQTAKTPSSPSIPRKESSGQESRQCEPPTPSAEEGEARTIVILSDDNMDYLKRHGGSVESLDAAARDYFRKGRYDDSFRCCQILSRIDPKQAGAWLGAGIALYEKDSSRWRTLAGQEVSGINRLPLDDASKAIQYFDKALELDPDNHPAWFLKGSSLAMIGQCTCDASKVRAGLECYYQALRIQPGHDATKKAIRDFRNFYATLQDHSNTRSEAEGLCDVCSFPMNFTDGYFLTTKQVVPTVGYWEVVLKGQFQALLGDDKEAKAAFVDLVFQQAGQNSGWLVCEVCADLFQFDRACAKEYARKRINPPDAGPLSVPMEALVPANVARLKLKEQCA